MNLWTKSGASPLYIACENGHDNIERLLLKKGADVNLVKKHRSRPSLC